MSLTESLRHYTRIPSDIVLECVQYFIILVKQLALFLGLTNKKNYEDVFYQLLHDKNYDEALRLARQEKYLDIDLVYKCKWRNSGITVQSINSVLGNIQDKLWAINECVKTVPMTYEACRRLLDYGLKEANMRLLYELGYEPVSRYSDNGKLLKRDKIRLGKEKKREPFIDEDMSDDAIQGLIDFKNLNEQQKELCRFRQNLIRYEHSLFCYESILGDYRIIQQSFDHVFYDEFRRKCPLNICIDFANTGDPGAVETCLLFYTDELKQHLLAILANFPETLSPYQYRNLLPCLRENENVFVWKAPPNQTAISRTIDWSQCDATASLEAFLREKSEAFEKEFYDKNEELQEFLRPMTGDLLTKWFIYRALEMESKTLLLGNAIQLLHLGSELNIKNLETTHDDLMEFDRIVYDCCTDSDIYLSFGEFTKMTEVDRLILMTGECHKNCKDRFRFYLIPYLQRREQINKLDNKCKIQLLQDYFRKLAHTREKICKLIYEDLLDRIESDNFVAEWTKGLDDSIDEIGEEIKRIERARQVKEISTIAGQTFALNEFNECYEACQLIMKKGFHECWALCCQLGMHKQFKSYEAKYRLLAFALAHCDDSDGKMSAKMLEYIIDLRKRDETLQMAYLKGNM